MNGYKRLHFGLGLTPHTMKIPRTRATIIKMNWDIGSAAWGASSSSSPFGLSSTVRSSCRCCFSSDNFIELCSDMVAGVSVLELGSGTQRWFSSLGSWSKPVVVVAVIVGGGCGGGSRSVDYIMLCVDLRKVVRKR